LSVERWTLSNLRREFPEMAGLSALNLWRMRALYLAYAASDQKLSQAVTESDLAAVDARHS
jgi:hypothetical protein